MNQTIRAIVGSIFVLIIIFSAISICQNAAGQWKIDVTEQKLYTLSDGTKAILGKLNQPIQAKLYYTKTAAMKGPDQIKFFNNYYEFVKSLLQQYAAVSSGKFELQIIDPRPYSDDEADAIRFGLQQYKISQEESFFFGLVIQTQFGVEKTIPFFSPERQNFIEYDISYLIDTAIARQKKKIGILSSLPIMGDDTSDYMVQLMQQQGQAPRQPWTFVEQLRRKFEVSAVAADVNDINNVDILLVIHPKNLPDQTMFAIDQFILKGGRTIVCIDPYCFADTAGQSSMTGGVQPRNSQVDALINNWGLKMPTNTFAGDRKLAEIRQISATTRSQTIIGLLDLLPGCFNKDNVISAELSDVRILFAGALQEITPDPNKPQQENNIKRTPLIMTTAKGNTFTISSPYEMMVLDPENLINRFREGSSPVVMGYSITGRFKSSFPDGLDIKIESEDPNKTTTTHLAGLTEARDDCAVVVFSDVDFISDSLAYGTTFFGKVIVGDNSALMLNAIDDLCGSGDLVAIRSRGNYKKPFIVVDEIERQAEAQTQDEIGKLDLKIASYNAKLQSIVSSSGQNEQAVIGSQIVQQRRQIEDSIYQAEREKRSINMQRLEQIDKLGMKLQRANTLAAPAVILAFAIILSIKGSLRKRHYISHKSDA
jgi:ABC-2 type transport system permease protein